ncbi:IS6 family transposase [Halorussus ruber]|uniref:IS6 family transposase n=1 Tax=Halorussus ruber TaxID=1126238 RepID=UPI001091ABA1|nr:IS6 family transposase [Halorussus ruber]
MPEFSRLNECSDWIELDFVEREATPEPLMKLSIHLHAAGLSLTDTVSVLERFGVERCRSTIHNWVQKADLQPTDGKDPNHVAVDETVSQLNDQRYWLYAAVNPETNEFLHVRLYPTRTIVVTKQFLTELQEKHRVADAVFLVDGAPWLQAALFEQNLRFQQVTHGNRNSVERVFKEVKRRTNQFANHFRRATHRSAENWLQTLAFAWNQLI